MVTLTATATAVQWDAKGWKNGYLGMGVACLTQNEVADAIGIFS